MPIPALLVLLMAGGALAVASTSKSAAKSKLPLGKQIPTPERSYAPTFVAAESRARTIDLLGIIFGSGFPGEYPAPYRYEDARKIALIALSAASETAPITRGHYEVMRARFAQVEASALPNALRTYAMIFGVIKPMFQAGLWWHWYRPRSKSKSARYQAIATWMLFFFLLPGTATAAVGVDPDTPWSATINVWEDYLSSVGKLRGALNPQQTRRLLYDVYWSMILWPRQDDPDRDWWKKFEKAAVSSFLAYESVFPPTAGDENLIEGNYALLTEMLGWLNTRVESEIKIDFDEGKAYAMLVVKAVLMVASGVAPLLSPVAAALLTAAVSIVQAIAIASTSNTVPTEQIQAIGGLAVTEILSAAGIDLGLGELLTPTE